jgi:hypothetical protein
MKQKERPSLQKYLNKKGKMPDLQVWSPKFKLHYVIETKENQMKEKKVHKHMAPLPSSIPMEI